MFEKQSKKWLHIIKSLWIYTNVVELLLKILFSYFINYQFD